MADVVKEFPRKTRTKKYPLKTWFNGDIHRLVQGEDFTIKDTSMKTTLYNAASKDFKVKVKVQWELEGPNEDILVAYVQATGPKTAKPAKRKARK